MANDNLGGVWRTIGGRKVFIKNGQSLSEAMIESGKFKNIRSEYRKEKELRKKALEEQEKKTTDKELKEKIGNDVKKLHEYADKEGILPSELQDRLGIKDSDLGLKDEYTEKFEQEMQGMGRYLKAEEAKNKSYSEMTQEELDDIAKAEMTEKEYKLYEKTKPKEEKINPMEEYSDTNGKGMTDAQEKLLNAVKTSFIYKDEGEMASGLQKNYELYGKENVDSALKYYEDNYEVIKGTGADSEGLTYNHMLAKKDYPKEDLAFYKEQMEKLYKSGLQYSNSKQYNEKAKELSDFLERNKRDADDQLRSAYKNDLISKEDYKNNNYDALNEFKNYNISDTQISKISPYDDTDYSWARKQGEKWIVKNPIKSEYDTKEFNSAKEAFNEVKSINNHIMGGDTVMSNEGITKHYQDKPRETKQANTNNQDKDRETFKKIADFYGYNKMDNDAIKRTLDDAEKKGLYHSKNDIEAMRRYLDRTVIEKDTGSAYSKPGKRYEVLEESKSAYGDKIYKVRDEEGNVSWEKASKFETKTDNKMNDTLRRKAYQKYMKEHPGSKMTFEDFMK